MKPTTETIIRTVLLAVTWINTGLTASGKNPLPFSDEEIYTGVSGVLTFAATAWAWRKNNSFTRAAVEADAAMKTKKEIGR